MSNKLQISKIWGLTEVKYGKLKTVEQAIDSESWSLARMSKHYGERDFCNLLGVMLNKLNAAAGLTKQMEGEQLRFIATNIISDYPTLKMADIVLFFNRLIKGYYGELYNNISTDKIFSNLNAYLSERLEFSSTRSQKRHEKSGEVVKSILTSEQIEELYSKNTDDD